MKRPAQRRFHRAPALGVRISGWSGPGTAAQPRIKSNQSPRHACSLSTNRREHNSRLRAEVPRTAKIIFWVALGGGPGGSRQAHFKRACAPTKAPPAEALVDAGRPRNQGRSRALDKNSRPGEEISPYRSDQEV